MEDQEIRVVGDGRRLDVQLSEVSGLSRSRVAALMDAGYCLVDGEPCRKAGTKPAEGKPVVLTVPAPREAAPQAEDIPLEVLYEDDDLAVIVKPRGMVVHPAAGHEDGTLVNALLARLSSLSGIGGELRLDVVALAVGDNGTIPVVEAESDPARHKVLGTIFQHVVDQRVITLEGAVFDEDVALLQSRHLHTGSILRERDRRHVIDTRCIRVDHLPVGLHIEDIAIVIDILAGGGGSEHHCHHRQVFSKLIISTHNSLGFLSQIRELKNFVDLCTTHT